MGEAKRRGTAEERKASAEQNGDMLGRPVKNGQAPHYAIILDRSETGLKMLSGMRTGPAELRSRINSQAVLMWEQMSQFEFVVIWGSWGYSGGLTIPTVDLQSLLNESLPKVLQRVKEKGGLCMFMPGVADNLQEVIANRLGELQP